MVIKRTELYKDNPNVFYDAYISDKRSLEGGRPAILILPGGAYQYCSEREGEPVAKQFLARGYNAFVLNYSVAPQIVGEKGEFLPLVEAARTIADIRRRCEEFLINPDKVAVIGFSAGGHLAGMLETKWHTPELAMLANASCEEIKPNAVILSYAPSVSSFFADMFASLVGNKVSASEEVLNYFSVDKNVDANTPPTFIWHTLDDEIVPVECSLMLALAMKKAGVGFEMHIYPYGKHGLSVCNDEVKTPNEYAKDWIPSVFKWLESLFG